jgi:hypothetical protein
LDTLKYSCELCHGSNTTVLVNAAMQAGRQAEKNLGKIIFSEKKVIRD